MCRWAGIFLLACVMLSGVGEAQPRVSLSAEAINDYRAVLFTFVQDDIASMDGCHYNLFAAKRAKDLRTLPGNGLSIATFFRAANVIQIIAAPLPHLARRFGVNAPRNRPTVKVYFRVLLSCPEAISGYGETISVTMRTYKGGKFKTVNELRKAMKYNMQYYNPS